jgi:hypothetical protein
MKKALIILVLAAFALGSLSCAPSHYLYRAPGQSLARSIDPAGVLEFNVSMAQNNDYSPGYLLSAYYGLALGANFELGARADYNEVYFSSPPAVLIRQGTFSALIKWDPFPFDSWFHLTAFLGPELFIESRDGGEPVANFMPVYGLGALVNIGGDIELYAALSAKFVMPSLDFGLRIGKPGGFQVGLNLGLSQPELMTIGLSFSF